MDSNREEALFCTPPPSGFLSTPFCTGDLFCDREGVQNSSVFRKLSFPSQSIGPQSPPRGGRRESASVSLDIAQILPTREYSRTYW